ncbi:hypothetical protein NP493_4950g00004 [Ridgeia piscesae]|uniref:Uncharacterized protein n=1 Tax=Ridgeia piscesae TaxID=27915 RepID=A0AAD9IX57_RIDPI|nr:hypothetical protein NP493_4950g00004 [Ridgeia piscesae]
MPRCSTPVWPVVLSTALREAEPTTSVCLGNLSGANTLTASHLAPTCMGPSTM